MESLTAGSGHTPAIPLRGMYVLYETGRSLSGMLANGAPKNGLISPAEGFLTSWSPGISAMGRGGFSRILEPIRSHSPGPPSTGVWANEWTMDDFPIPPALFRVN